MKGVKVCCGFTAEACTYLLDASTHGKMNTTEEFFEVNEWLTKTSSGL